ncbi:DUF4065 domain-containing protein [Shouchella clausii]|uniref:Panacea domain-containing protein n=1 Tax=Shouchella TaxID=2893057 RepID=UPI00068D5963|nr:MULTISPECIES: DUF4065 domain-containing protein [Shouchella]MBU3231056.1 DUF4065 domain-containing protein [Shouchella clausii]MBU3262869.1 DUF4065 domain-containing protein [Shouchella clausii]MBU3505333.1 DUF4065 domain-containing protein [Shouchella clausii]MBU3534899.1 DUF4065 domain-containing protein [Shouchella clausii]MBX0310067.1 DUF4065 domain-containing protein [Shouchella clausii]
MQRLAEHVIAVANNNQQDVTNLQLQKAMFITLGLHLREQNGIDDLARQLDSEASFARWKYGPVVESEYYKYNRFGSRPIENPFASQVTELDYLNNNIIRLLEMDPFALVQFTHELRSWEKYEREILEGKYVPHYTLEEIFEDFRNER